MLSSDTFLGAQPDHSPFGSGSSARTPGGKRRPSNSGWPRSLGIVLLMIAIQPGTTCRVVLTAASPSLQQQTSQQGTRQQGQVTPEAEPALTKKQKKALLKHNFEKMKLDADELAELAKSLQEDLNKSNENVLSLGVVDKADRIEKLAKRIKGTARGL